ncbi:hypothetical protein EGR_04140 [Echinococcus granulosus]|uniref:Uncharacterized protein n=1 Tax=Echinococcus granulosus TaxID=6210 RepID=W6V471_ECHGR|nr:hypothetical protein EGR_04140 [Echinococcus granulosus]EUB60894.1 hypothetical protein EGR_04140 [Echinococcus granulosus]
MTTEMLSIYSKESRCAEVQGSSEGESCLISSGRKCKVGGVESFSTQVDGDGSEGVPILAKGNNVLLTLAIRRMPRNTPTSQKRSRSRIDFPLRREDILSQHSTPRSHLIAMRQFNNATHLKSVETCDPDSARWHYRSCRNLRLLSESYGAACFSEFAFPTPPVHRDEDFHLHCFAIGPVASSASTMVTIFDMARLEGSCEPDISLALG